MIFVFVIVPSMLFLADFGQHHIIKNDSDSALRQAGIYAMKEGIVKGSLRDTNVTRDIYGNPTNKYRTQYAVNPKEEVALNAFKESFSKHARGVLLNYAERNPDIAVSHSPPMLAIRSNTVRDSLLYNIIGKIVPSASDGTYVIQNEKIIILEMKETE